MSAPRSRNGSTCTQRRRPSHLRRRARHCRTESWCQTSRRSAGSAASDAVRCGCAECRAEAVHTDARHVGNVAEMRVVAVTWLAGFSARMASLEDGGRGSTKPPIGAPTPALHGECTSSLECCCFDKGDTTHRGWTRQSCVIWRRGTRARRAVAQCARRLNPCNPWESTQVV